jgi:DNA-binding CsgD family transcriptional regulator/small-conductance mechanosensitive channel
LEDWLVNNWFNIFVPFLAFITITVIGLWARWAIRKFLKQPKQTWAGNAFVIETIWHPFLYWFLMLGVYVAIQISILSPIVKRVTGEGLASLFALCLIWTTINLSERLIRFYLGKTKVMQSLIYVALSIARIVIIVTGILVILEIWGAPTLPIILVLIAGLLIVGFAFRNTFDNLLAGFEIVYGEHIKVGHFIKSGSGEEGHVTKISWTRTTIRSIGGNLVIIPNHKLMANSIINYGAVAAVISTNDVRKDLVKVEPSKPIDALSEREREVLSLIGNGATNREIAQKLIISEHTVKSHLRSILNKLNISNRQQAAVYAERAGLIVGLDVAKTDSESLQ